MYKEIMEQEYRNAHLVPLQAIKAGDSEIVLFRADKLPAGIKQSIGKCLLAWYVDNGRINQQTKAVVVHGSGNTVRSVKLAVDDLSLRVKVIAVVYAETSSVAIKDLNMSGIEVVAETPRDKGRIGRQNVADKLCRKKGHVLLEQHEAPAIIEIQRQTFGQSIMERLGVVTDFVAGVGTGGTLFGIGEACRRLNSATRLTALEGVCSTLTLWHAYMRAKGRGFAGQKKAIEQALALYQQAGMEVSLQCHPELSPPDWFDIGIDIPEGAGEVVGIEGLGVGNPSDLIRNNLASVDAVRIITDEQAVQGIRQLAAHGIEAVTSAGANFFAALEIAAHSSKAVRILTIVTATRR